MRTIQLALFSSTALALIGASVNAFLVQTGPPCFSRDRVATTTTFRRKSAKAKAVANNNDDIVKQLIGGGDYSDKQIWRSDDTELNIVNKYIVIRNFTIETSTDKSSTLENPPPPLSIGRIYVHWESFWYHERSFDIDLHNIDLYIEFSKGLFSSSNWNELNDMDFWDWCTADVEDENELVHFSSIHMTGNLTITVASRPLGKTIATFPLNLDDAVVDDDLNAKIRTLSDANLAAKGRKGCTSAEILELLKNFVYDQIRSFMGRSSSKK